MSDPNWVNTGIFIKKKSRFDLKSFKKVRDFKYVFLNERVVEIPYVLSEVSKLSNCKEILDFGCSASLVPQYFSSLGYNVTGLDLRDYPYEFPNFTFVKEDLFKSSLQEDSFDALVCISTLEHVGLGFYGTEQRTDDFADIVAVKKLKSMIKPGGSFLLTVPFGKYHVNEHMRVYNSERIQKITDEFNVKDLKFFVSKPSDDGTRNHWVSVSQDEASKVEFVQWVHCVVCMHLTK